jgi:hypothetical protein
LDRGEVIIAKLLEGGEGVLTRRVGIGMAACFLLKGYLGYIF